MMGGKVVAVGGVRMMSGEWRRQCGETADRAQTMSEEWRKECGETVDRAWMMSGEWGREGGGVKCSNMQYIFYYVLIVLSSIYLVYINHLMLGECTAKSTA
jgi:hypothetical protein